MKFIGLLLLFMSSVFIVGCSGFTRIVEHDANDPAVMVQIDSQQVPGRKTDAGQEAYRATMLFYEWTDFDGVVQEITLDDGRTLVEYFLLRNGQFPMCYFDVHYTIGATKDFRQMLVYPANVEGVDYASGYYAILPQNKDGSVKTTTGKDFNADYLKKHEVRGKVVIDDRARAAYWTLKFAEGKLNIVVPNKFKVK